MCGRYYIDDETAREIEKLVRCVDEKLHGKSEGKRSIDIFPTEKAPVIIAGNQKLCCSRKHWGFFQTNKSGKNRVIINRRSESISVQPGFKEFVKRNRAVIPASGFYEWNNLHEKSAFYDKEHGSLYMLGYYQKDICGDRFVIFTQEANTIVRKVHHRMPVLIKQSDIYDFLTNDNTFDKYLQGSNVELARKQCDYEQMCLF